MNVDITVAIIAAMVSIGLGLINILLSVSRLKHDGVTKNRVEWIANLRLEVASFLSWDIFGDVKAECSIEESYTNLYTHIAGNYESMYRIILYLNINGLSDKEIVQLCKDIMDINQLVLNNMLILMKTGSKNCNSLFLADNSDKLVQIKNKKEELLHKVRIYLKKEWTRVKVESKFIKMPFRNYWIPFFGFSEKWATKSLNKKYKSETIVNTPSQVDNESS